MPTHAISVTVEDRPGMLFKTTQVLTESAADIRYVDILHRPSQTEIFFDCDLPTTALGRDPMPSADAPTLGRRLLEVP